MSLLAFLTGMAGGSSDALDEEREATRKEQEAELTYRRANLEHMVRAAEEGRVDPSMVGRVFEEYMNAQPGLSSRPFAGKKGKLTGRRDLGQNNLMRDIATGAVSLFGKQPGALNIDWGAGQDKVLPTNKPGIIGTPDVPDIPQFARVPGSPLGQLVDEAAARAMPAPGGGLYKHPDTVKMEQDIDVLKKLVNEKAITNAFDISKTKELYGPGGVWEDRYGRTNRPGARRIYQDKDGNLVDVIWDPSTETDMVVIPGRGSIPLSMVPPEMGLHPANPNVFLRGADQYYGASRYGSPTVTPTGVKAPPPASQLPPNPAKTKEQIEEEQRDLRRDFYNKTLAQIKSKMDEASSYSRTPSAEDVSRIEREAYEMVVPSDIRANYPTWKEFQNSIITVTPSAPQGSASTDREEFIKAVGQALQNRAAQTTKK